jgi:hypothetical protein
MQGRVSRGAAGSRIFLIILDHPKDFKEFGLATFSATALSSSLPLKVFRHSKLARITLIQPKHRLEPDKPTTTRCTPHVMDFEKFR